MTERNFDFVDASLTLRTHRFTFERTRANHILEHDTQAVPAF